jgi:hypothetical protein
MQTPSTPQKPAASFEVIFQLHSTLRYNHHVNAHASQVGNIVMLKTTLNNPADRPFFTAGTRATIVRVKDNNSTVSFLPVPFEMDITMA